jgi:hypothetical protein
VVHNSLSGPKLFEAHWATRVLNIPSHYILEAVSLEFMKGEGLLTAKLEIANITKEVAH